ncbi:MAG: hypothetical protein KO464_01080 [Candidatus Methanofastidiosum sp.]|nr:hypothetical protein [Methanofastidiosum sp.]
MEPLPPGELGGIKLESTGTDTFSSIVIPSVPLRGTKPAPSFVGGDILPGPLTSSHTVVGSPVKT